MDMLNVLFVDDEVNILNSIRRAAIGEEFKTLIATNGEAALALFEDNEISVIVTDMRMPKMNGLELLDKVKEISPNTIRMVLSGYAQIPQVIATVNKVGVFKYITKPWDNEREFLPAIKEALQYYSLKKENEIIKSQLEEKNKLYKKMLDNNNMLIRNNQADIGAIKIITRKFLNLKDINSKGTSETNNSNQVKKQINSLLDKTFFEYIDTVPTIKESFTISIFNDRFNKVKESGANIIFQNESIKNITYWGNKKTFTMVLDSIINIVSNHCDNQDIIIDIINTNSLCINLLIKNKSSMEELSNDIQAKIIINLLEEICKIIGAKLIINTEKLLITVNTNFQVQS